jgi:hypothetical protein
MNMETAFNLSESNSGTDMKWEAEVKIAGPVGSMGQRVLQPIVSQQVNHVLAALDEQVQEASAQVSEEEYEDAGPPAEGPAEPEGTSGADEGISPLSPEGYDEDPEGPTKSTEEGH